MDEHKSHGQIIEEITDASLHIKLNGVYSHYKDRNNTYKVSGFGTLEADNELCVIYESVHESGLIFIRPVKEWLQTVEWNGAHVLRFQLVR